MKLTLLLCTSTSFDSLYRCDVNWFRERNAKIKYSKHDPRSSEINFFTSFIVLYLALTFFIIQ